MKVFILAFLLSTTSFAVDLGDCAKQVGFDIYISTGATGDLTNQVPLVVKGNKVSVNDPSAIITKEIGDEKEIYKYKVALADGTSEVRTLTINKDPNGNYTVVRKDDIAAQKKAAIKAGFYDQSFESYPVRSGMETHYSAKNGKCDVTQAMSLRTLRGKDFTKEVYVDKKYCDSIENLLKSETKEKVQQCISILDKAQKVFDDRRTDLLKENKMFINHENGFIGAAMKIAMCSPQEFQIRLDALRGFGIGNGYYNFGGGIGTLAPKSKNSALGSSEEQAKGTQ